MALSYEESKKLLMQQAAMPAVMSLSNETVDNTGIMTLDESPVIAAYSGNDGSWTQHTGYDWYTGTSGVSGSLGYDDDAMSNIDSTKNVSLNSKQFNINQEHKSQFIPFEMPRYYDGYDLTKATIGINYRRNDGDIRTKKAVNVRYNNEKIQFGWLVEAHATEVVGKLEFEIVAFGTDYIWKSRMVKDMNVLESIPWSDELVSIESDDTWVSEIVEAVTEQIVGMEFNEQLAAAEQAVKDAQQAANNAENAATNAVTNALVNYSTTAEMESYVEQEIANADIDNKLTAYAKTSEVEALVGDIGESKDVVDYVDKKVNSIDVSEQIGELGTDDEGNPITTVVDYVDKKVGSVDVSKQLKNYYTKSETYSSSEIDTKLGSVTVDLTGYATETYVNDKTGILSSYVATNTENISLISKTLGELQEDIGAIDNSPRLTYDVAYNDTEDEDVGENVFVLYEITGEGTENEVREAKRKFTIVGGSGGGSSSSLKISYVTTSPVIATVNDKVLITYNFSGTDSSCDIVPEGNYTWKIGSKIIASGIATYGENTFDATDFATTTSQKFVLTITDDAGSLATKSWTVQKVDLRLESTFSDAYGYQNDVAFNYTPYGSIQKDVHFILDGEELGVVKTSTSGIPTSYTIPAQSHGSHLLEVYMTATINNALIESNHIYKDILWQDVESGTPIIGCATQNIDAMQYNTINIKYTVLDPNTETPKVTWSVDGNTVSEETLTEKDAYGYYTFSYKANEAGTFVLTISCGEAEPKKITVKVEELNINVSPVTAGLEFDFNPVGYSNSSADRLWSYNNVTMTVSDNFDWVNGGYQIDENGDQYFCVKAGTNAVINYNLFADDPKKTGKEFKVIFRTKNIRKRDTSFLTCIDENIGLDMKVEYTTVHDSGGSLKSNYCENTIIEYEFNINKDTDMPIIMTYEDGAPSKPYEYTETSSFKQSSPKPITIGSEDCDIFIYRMKAYSISLTDTDIKNNFIADARNADEIIARYNRNNIYNEDGKLISTSASGDFSADALMKAAPDLRYIFLEVPQFTNDKDNKIDGCTVHFRYPAGTRPQDNWTCTGMRHRGQGTSSNLYGYAGRNIDLCMDRDESLFTWADVDEDGKPITVESSTITLTDTSVPTDYLNIKVNIASSENANNAQLARRFNEYQPFLRYARKKDSRVKDTMEFYNCVVFIRETSTDLSNTPHREFNDTDWHFYAIGNVGDSKKTDDTRVNNKRDPKEHIIEITDADKPLSAFPTGKDGHAVCPVGEWKSGNTAYDILHSTEYIYDEEGAFESFGGKTYEFRYEMKNITEEQREENINAWRDLYKFIVTSTDEEFHANLKNYFVVDSALYFYLFTERYTMVDNRAKNSFWHYGKVYISEAEAAELGETEASYYIIDDAAAAINDGYRYDLTQGYDMDTALGIDNTGDYVFSYGKEDTDYYVDGDPTSDYVFRVADSVFFCRLRDLFPSEMQAMFKNREEKNAWNSTSLIDQCDNSQVQFPEELWRLDYERKYYRTYLGLSIDNSIVPLDENGEKKKDKSFLIGKFFGRKKYARRAFEINQEIYFATKYFGNKALSDVFWIRGNVPIGGDIKPNYSLTLVPYSDMYVCVQYTSTGTPIHQKVKAGQTCYFESNAERMDFIYVYAASYIQEVGDLSRCFIGDNNFSSATRLQRLTIGSTDEGYENTFMKEVLVDSNPLLEYLDLRNISGINTVINVNSCSNLKELYAEGTNATGVIFANGGLLETAHLPNTLVSLSMKNLNYIKDFNVDGYDNLQTLIVENVPNISTYDIVNSSPSLKLVRLINLNWDAESSSILNRLFDIDGIDSSGYETDQSILTGIVIVPTIGQYELYKYEEVWSDLTIVPKDGVIPQYKVTFRNDDNFINDDGSIGTILDVQHVDQYGNAIDPTDEEYENYIGIPTKENTTQHSYTFVGWDKAFTNIIDDINVYATYEESIRDYDIQYVSMGTPIYTSTGKYGSNIEYVGEMPTYTSAEPTVFYLFDRWDKSGFLLEGEDGTDLNTGTKTVTAIFDTFRYTANAFTGRSLNDLRPVEIYALSRLINVHNNNTTLSDYGMNIVAGDKYSFEMGYDIEYDDIKSVPIVVDGVYVKEDENKGTSAVFNGTNYIDTGIKLFDEDKDFVLAVDYKISSDNTSNGVFMQCFQTAGSNGFKLAYINNSPSFSWGDSSITPSPVDSREMIVIRHIKGDNNLYVYTSNLDYNTYTLNTIPKDNATNTIYNTTLVFGMQKTDGDKYANGCIGNINWCKIWYKDLGEDVCEKLAGWTHEKINLSVSGFNRYDLYDDPTKVVMLSLVADNLLDKTKAWHTSNAQPVDWKSSSLRTFLNSRFYNAIPTQIKSLMKKMNVRSTEGGKSTKITESDCYVTLPSLYDLDSSQTDYVTELYDQYDISKTITTMQSPDARKRAFNGGDYYDYWTRSPNFNSTSSNQYVWFVVDGVGDSYYTLGNFYGIKTLTTKLGVLVEISF
jgi:hypothetical protein